jgi:endonuclease YncB( thermonuclease family)
MDLEALVLSTTPLAVAAAHEPPDEVASVVDGRPFRLADGRLAAIAPPLHGPSDEDKIGGESVLAAKSAREALWSGESVAHPELPATGHAQTLTVAVAACCICLPKAERDGRNGGFGFWSDPYQVVKQASDRADVFADQGRFALVRGKVSS